MFFIITSGSQDIYIQSLETCDMQMTVAWRHNCKIETEEISFCL